MKNMKSAFLLFFTLILNTLSLSAQTLALDCESGNRSVEQANCWVFGAVSYSSTASQVITGTWSARSNSMSNPSAGASWIKTPWFKPGEGNITFKTKLENSGGTSGGSNYKAVRVRVIPYDPNASYGEGLVLADSFQYTFVAPYTSAVDVSWAVPAAIANSGNPYKLIISFLGVGGNNRANFDNLVIPGTYWADPSNNCLPMPNVQDADDDGVSDPDDDYPADPYRAFNNWFPANGLGVLMFEDLWPNVGDYDLNDLVVDYRFNTVTDAENEVVEIKYTFIIRAVGASRRNAFAFQIDDLDPEHIIGVSGAQAAGAPWLLLAANGTEADQEHANIIVRDDVKEGFSLVSAGNLVNVNYNDPALEKDTVWVTLVFKNNGQPGVAGALEFDEISPSDFNPYLIVGQDRGKEVHLANYEPTDRMNVDYLGEGQDASDAAQNRYFTTLNNLPWALNIYNATPNLAETIDFTQGFLKFSEWAQSGGVLYADWFLDEPGYRNTEVLINR